VRNVVFKISLNHVDLSTCLPLHSSLIELMYVRNIKLILWFGYCIKLKVLYSVIRRKMKSSLEPSKMCPGTRKVRVYICRHKPQAQDRDRWWALVSAVRNLRVP